MADVAYIYGLVDPLTSEIFYVGKTTNLLRRLGFHLKDKRKCDRTKWIGKLNNIGRKPVIIILETASGRTWPARERWWIRQGRKVKWPLTNVSGGGEGAPKYNNDSRRGKNKPNTNPKVSKKKMIRKRKKKKGV